MSIFNNVDQIHQESEVASSTTPTMGTNLPIRTSWPAASIMPRWPVETSPSCGWAFWATTTATFGYRRRSSRSIIQKCTRSVSFFKACAKPVSRPSPQCLVLSGWANTKTVVRRYFRTSPQHRGDEIKLEEQFSNGLLSVYRPLMFRMDLHPGGRVQLFRDGHHQPFLQFEDRLLSANYIGFCSWDVPLVFFYDCPMEIDGRSCEGNIAFT